MALFAELYILLILTVHANCEFSYKESLLLTPYISENRIEQARTDSRVFLDGLGFPEIVSHSGYITVDERFETNFFFWFFPSEKPNAPLMMWINGGPAISAMLGLFWENGPFSFCRRFGFSLDEPSVKLLKREASWTSEFSMLYVDNPAGAGFNFFGKNNFSHFDYRDGEGPFKITQDGYAHDLYNFLEQFVQIFPDHNDKGVYIGGQSYGGKFVTSLGHKIHVEKEARRSKIHLKGVYLGGAYFDPPGQSNGYLKFCYALGVLSKLEMQENMKKVENLFELYKNGSLRNNTTSEVYRRYFECPATNSFDNFVTGEHSDLAGITHIMNFVVRYHLHVGYRQKFNVIDLNVFDRFGSTILDSVKDKLSILLDNYKVLLYSGNYDVIVSAIMVEEALLKTNWSGKAEYEKAGRKIWFRSHSLEKGQFDHSVAGYYTKVKNLCRVIIQGAGHQTPRDQPEVTLDMMRQFVTDGCITKSVRTKTAVTNIGLSHDNDDVCEVRSEQGDIGTYFTYMCCENVGTSLSFRLFMVTFIFVNYLRYFLF